jgi:signal peptidase I
MELQRKRNNSLQTRCCLILLALAVVAILVPTYLHAYSLSGSSDAPTLLLGDKVLVNQAAYWVKVPYTQIKLLHVSRPKRGEMVLIRALSNLFLSLTGLPGETIEIQENHVIINVQALPLRALSGTDFSWVPASHYMGSSVFDEEGHWVAFTPGAGEHRNFAPIRLKEDEYFLLGDNRDSSLDGRVWGPLKEDAIFGKVILIVPTGVRNK